MIEQWNELKETIKELRDNGGAATQQMICHFLANYMDILEKQQIQESDNDIISRKMVVEFLRNHSKDLEGTKNEIIRFSQAFMFAASTIEDTNIIPPTTIEFKQASKWISVDDMLPKEDVRVLVCNKHGDMEVSTGWNGVTEKKWHWDADGYYGFGDVVAWRPLPEPYKMKKDK